MFSEDTPVSVINTPDNLRWLCPNCHWELDNGLRTATVHNATGLCYPTSPRNFGLAEIVTPADDRRAIGADPLSPSAPLAVPSIRDRMSRSDQWFAGSPEGSTSRHRPFVVDDAGSPHDDERHAAFLHATVTERMLSTEGFRVSAPASVVSLGCGVGLLRSHHFGDLLGSAPEDTGHVRIPTCVGM